jgi:hypothetical protein
MIPFKHFKYCVCIIICLLGRNLVAQVDSLAKEISNHLPSKAVIISQARALLQEKLLNNDFVKAAEIRSYLVNELQDADYLALYGTENVLICFATSEFAQILSYYSDTSIDQEFGNIIKPLPDKLNLVVYELVKQRLLIIKSEIESSDLNSMNKDFLFLILNDIDSNEINEAQAQNKLNSMADEYLSKYPNSPYDYYIRHYCRYVYKPSDWGLGFEFFTGRGYFTEELSKKYTTNTTIGIAFDIYYNRSVLYLRNYIGFNKTRIDQTSPNSDTTWQAGSKVNVYLPEASIGYLLYSNKQLAFTPFAGISAIDISPRPSSNEIFDAYSLNYRRAFTFGLNIDITLGKHSKTFLVAERSILRVRYGFTNGSLDKEFPGFSGDMHYITIGIGGITKKIKREF